MNNITGDEIWSPKLIAKNYLLSIRFILDVISLLPFDFFKIGKGTVADLCGLVTMIKVVRVPGINKIISNLNKREDVKA